MEKKVLKRLAICAIMIVMGSTSVNAQVDPTLQRQQQVAQKAAEEQ